VCTQEDVGVGTGGGGQVYYKAKSRVRRAMSLSHSLLSYAIVCAIAMVLLEHVLSCNQWAVKWATQR